MNQKLENMKADINRRIKRYTGLAVCTMAFLGVAATDVLPVDLGNEAANEYVSGFQVGLLCTLLVAFLASIVNYRKALKDEKVLKQLYYKENDERMSYIYEQVGKSSMTITMVILLIATIIAGYFNLIVFITMIAVTVLQLVIQLTLKWYYTNCVTGKEKEE